MMGDPTEEQTRSGGVLLSLLQGPVEIHLQRGGLDEARRIFSLFRHLESSEDVQDRASYLSARAALSAAEGRFGEALADAETAIEAAGTLGYAPQAAKQAVVVALESALALSDTGKAAELIAFLEAAPAERRAPFYEAQAQRFRARTDGDEARFRISEHILREHELAFWLAVVQLEHAELLVGSARAEEAAPLVAEARETFERLEAAPWLVRLAQVSGEREAVAG
jgi:tetratricopeptide (TPR) repeat protein